MSITATKLYTLPVETESGRSVGKVCDVVLNEQTHTVEQYEVLTHRSLRKPFGTHLLVHASQVVSITAQKMVIEDLTLPSAEPVLPTPEIASA